MDLYLVSLATAIGRDHRHSLRWTYIKFLLLACLALACGVGLAGKKAPLLEPPTINYSLGLVASFGIEIVFVMALLGSAHFFKRTTFGMLLELLPLKRHQRTIALLLPDISLCFLILLLLGLPLRNALLGLGLPDWLASLSIASGLLASFGLVYGLGHKKHRPVVWLSVLGLQLLGCRLISLPRFHEIGLVLLAFCLLGLLAHVLQISRVTNRSVSKGSKLSVRHLSLPTAAWMLQKLFGNTRSLVSVLTLCVYSAGLTMASALHYLPATILCTLASILAASFMSDVRGISRKYIPAEIANLKGTAYFMSNMAWGFACGSAIFIPVLWSMQSLTIQNGVLYISQLLLGISIGLFSSCIFVPQDRDIHSQFITVLLALLVLILLPRLPIMQTHSPPLLACYNLLLALMAIATSYRLEYKRNAFYWR